MWNKRLYFKSLEYKEGKIEITHTFIFGYKFPEGLEQLFLLAAKPVDEKFAFRYYKSEVYEINFKIERKKGKNVEKYFEFKNVYAPASALEPATNSN